MQQGKDFSNSSDSSEKTKKVKKEKSKTLSDLLKKIKKEDKSGEPKERSNTLIGDDLWKKIKTFGGKNVGEEG